MVDNSDAQSADEDKLFTFNVKLTDPFGEDIWFSIGDSTGPIKFDNPGERVNGAPPELGSDGKHTGYYHVSSETVMNVKIKGGENIYLTNLATSSEYEITEVNPGDGFINTGITNDGGDETHQIPTATGKIAAGNTTYNVAYTNTFDAVTLKGDTALEATKKVIGHEAAEAFTFELQPDADTQAAVTEGKIKIADGALTKTTANNISAGTTETVAFGDITFYEEGTYKFTVDETTTTNAGGWTYDVSTYDISVIVSKDNGNLVASVTGNNPTFENKYEALPVNASIPVVKQLVIPEGLTGPDIAEKYTFKLTADSDEPLPAETELKNPAADGGTVSFGEITFTKPGTYIYHVKETGNVSGVANDPAAINKQVNILVTDNDDGTLNAKVIGADSTSTQESDKTTFVNTYATGEVTAQIPVTKRLVIPEGLTGPGSIKDKYTFTIAAESDNASGLLPDSVTVTNPTDNGGTVSFAAVTYSEPGEYKYKITESGTVSGVTNDAEAESGKMVTVNVTDNGDGTLSASIFGADGTVQNPLPSTTFTNTYSTGDIKASIPVKKVLTVPEGLTAPDITGKFTFTLAAEDGVPMPDTAELTNPDNNGGTVTFGDITYDKPGTYNYTVTETGEAVGITNDAADSKTATVVVTDNGDGTLSAVVRGADGTEDEPSSDTTFTNSYNVQPTTAKITANKVLKNANLVAGAFNFELSAENGTPVPSSLNATNKADGTVEFGEITYNKPGTFTYKIKETVVSADCYEYDETEKTVTVTVVDNSDGTLTATVSGDGEEAAFTNTYKVSSDEVFINAVKKINEEDASVNIFEFTITADDGGNLPETTTVNNNGGSIKFGPIKYDENIFADEQAEETDNSQEEPDIPQDGNAKPRTKTYHYTIKEKAGSADGYTYDTQNIEKVTIIVIDNGDGKLKAEIKYDDNGAVFRNKYAAAGNAIIKAKKVLKGKDVLVEGQFTFGLFEGNKKIGTAANDAKGNIKFDVSYDQNDVGEHNYTIKELVDKPMYGYKYDSSVKTVRVNIEDNGNGNLNAKVMYDEDMTFINTYRPLPTDVTLKADKTLKGKALTDGEFSFKLKNEDGKTVLRAKNDVNGKIVFSAVPITEAGEYKFTAEEEDNDEKNIIYDKNKHVYNVVVEDVDGKLEVQEITIDNGAEKAVFSNVYKGGGYHHKRHDEKHDVNPPTGEDGSIILWLMLAMTSSACIGAMLVKRKIQN